MAEPAGDTLLRRHVTRSRVGEGLDVALHGQRLTLTPAGGVDLARIRRVDPAAIDENGRIGTRQPKRRDEIDPWRPRARAADEDDLTLVVWSASESYTPVADGGRIAPLHWWGGEARREESIP